METETDKTLVTVFLGLDDANVAVSFSDGECRNLKVVSATHAELDGTVIAIPVNDFGVEADITKPGIQFYLAEVSEVRELTSGRLLYRRESPNVA